jgi:hypothetical protein
MDIPAGPHNMQGTRACYQAASGSESEPESVLPLDQKAVNQHIYTHHLQGRVFV